MTQLERLTFLRIMANIADIGWQPTETQPDAFDASDTVPTPDALACLEHLEATGDAVVYVRHASEGTRWMRIILGNSGWDMLSDYSAPRTKFPVDDAFDRATMEASDWAEAYDTLLREGGS